MVFAAIVVCWLFKIFGIFVFQYLEILTLSGFDPNISLYFHLSIKNLFLAKKKYITIERECLERGVNGYKDMRIGSERGCLVRMFK